ncbi:sigma 54-interacting transcriptional regulator [Sorangium sp. So ce385]|uniref:sigma 54-interacting transcriptional regulator n=1 Tax=Sorangium sp. So ce385 TaxID=3133308 RepID=UPI003F5BD508
MKRDNVILVSWVSFGSDPYIRDRKGAYQKNKQGEHIPGPALELLTNGHSPYRGKVEKAYFFVRRGPDDEVGEREIHRHEIEVFEELRKEIHKWARQLAVVPLIWETRDAPTAHQPLLKFTADCLRRVRCDHPEATLLVNLSPGTPQMHTTLLVALGARCAGDRVVAVQGIPRDKRREPERILEEVPWDLLDRLNVGESRPEVEAGRPAWNLEAARSPALQELLARIEEASRVPFPVLIHGGRGSGKTRVAERLRARHLAHRGRVGQGSWELRINCAALHRELLQSELFGHTKGAFTGALKAKKGLLELADGDSIFLDEIHHLEADAQAKLLVALERRGEFRPLGTDHPKYSRFRLIAATNLPLAELRRKLLPDFWDRIADFALRVPNLDECRDDLDGMWRCALRDACDDVAAVQARSPQDAASRATELFEGFREEHHRVIVKWLGAQELTGNWRDLQRLARRLVARTTGPAPFRMVNRGELQQVLEVERVAHAPEVAGAGASPEELLPPPERIEAWMRASAEEPIPMEEMCDTFERRLIEAAVRVKGSERAAATLVGVAQTTFNKRRRSLNERLAERRR